MTWLARLAVLVFVLFAASALPFLGQPLAAGPDDEKPKNLKVLPKDTSHRQVVEIMRGYSLALGVRCEECHYQSSPTEDPEFDSDKKPEKETARKMMKMTTVINDQIGQMKLKDSIQVACVTCHHGLLHPQTLGAVVTQSVAKKGVDGAIAEYRQLRDQYYGTGAYNFAPITLNDVAVQLAEGNKDFGSALKILDLNLEFAPKDANTYVTMARVQIAKGDRTGATASLHKALELDPDNRFAKRLLQQGGGQ
jgi:tetratricopeptide (TPR) repeat protein